LEPELKGGNLAEDAGFEIRGRGNAWNFSMCIELFFSYVHLESSNGI